MHSVLLLCVLNHCMLFQIHQSRHIEKDDSLKELEMAMERLLSESDRLKYKPARIFSTETNALANQWRAVEETLGKRITVINTKVSTLSYQSIHVFSGKVDHVVELYDVCMSERTNTCMCMIKMCSSESVMI